MPFFSIIIPSFNRAHLIDRPVKSILNQDFDDFELIIVDDGSIDNTKVVISEFQARDPRIKYIYQQNAERGAARNLGWKHATGKYLIFFDSDDEMCTNHLSVLKKYIDKNPEIRFLSTKFKLVEGSRNIPLTIDSFQEGWHEGKIYLTGTHTGVMICINRGNSDLHFFEEDRRYSTLEDWMFLTQNILRDKIYIIDQYTVVVNNHEQRSSRVDNNGIIRKRLLARDWIKKNVSLTSEENSLLEGYSYRFCAIHAYLDNTRLLGFGYVIRAIRETGPDRQLMLLLIKIIIGQKIIRMIMAKNQ